MHLSSTRAAPVGRCRFSHKRKSTFKEERPMKALAWKELREVFGITAIALAAYMMLVASLMGARVFDWFPGMPRGTREVPFLGEEFKLVFTIVTVLFAVAL